MPWFVPMLSSIGGFLAANAPAIEAGSAIAGAGTTIGMDIANSGGSGQPSTTSTPPAPTASQNIATETNNRMQQALLVRQQIPNLESQAPGLSTQSYDTSASTAAGLPGTFGAGGFDLNKILAMLGGGSGGPNGGPTDLMSIASGSTGGSLTG